LSKVWKFTFILVDQGATQEEAWEAVKSSYLFLGNDQEPSSATFVEEADDEENLYEFVLELTGVGETEEEAWASIKGTLVDMPGGFSYTSAECIG
jgi:hypothetical protein